MPIQVMRTLYSFDELNDKAKERAREWWRDCENQEPLDTEYLYSDFARMGALLGIEFDQRAVPLHGGGTRYEPTIYWTGFSSQGDGACFEGSYSYAKGAAKAIAKESGGTEKDLIDIARRLQEVQKKYQYRAAATVKHSGHYYHRYATAIDTYFDGDGNRCTSEDDHDKIGECMRDFMLWMYKALEAEYEYRMSDEQVDESIRINEYTFNEDGKRED